MGHPEFLTDVYRHPLFGWLGNLGERLVARSFIFEVTNKYIIWPTSQNHHQLTAETTYKSQVIIFL